MVKSKLLYTLIVLGIISGMGIQPAGAALQAVSPNILAPSGYPEWYQDTNDLALDLCIPTGGDLCLPLGPGEVLDPVLGVAGETFWWLGEAAMTIPAGGALAGDGLALIVLAMEAAFTTEGPTAGEQIAFGRLRIRISVGTAGTYTVTHPYGVEVYEVTQADLDATAGIRVINDDIGAQLVSSTRNLVGDVGCLAAPCDFNIALGSGIGPFLYWDSELPQVGADGLAYIGDPGIGHTVLGSPFGTNVFRIEGPVGANLGGPPGQENIAETNLFTIQGKVFTGAGDTAPTAVADPSATLLDTPVMIDVLANDTHVDVPINPTSISITNGVGGTAQTQVVDGKVMVNFTPAAGFSGPASFSYTVASFTGLTSAPTTVNVMVEDLQVARAVLRTKFMKYRIQGTSSDTLDNRITVRLPADNLNATLNGAQEVPPVTTDGSGTATVRINDDQTRITSSLNVQGLLNLTAAHIHVGGNGAAGPIIFNLSLTDFASPLNNTLTAADLVPQAAQGINTFADAVNAILTGNAYINVHTTGNPGGEIRGRIGPIRIIGSTQVGTDGSWRIDSQLPLGLDESGTISIESSNSLQLNDMPVELR